MSGIEIRGMDAQTEYFVATCSHVNESEGIDAAGKRRLAWLKAMQPKGLRVLTAMRGEEPMGCAYLMPVEACPWGPAGEDLMVMPCVWVPSRLQKQGAGTALVQAAVEAARATGLQALVTFAYEWDFWFMPVVFFKKMGFIEAAREGQSALMWHLFDADAKPPAFLERCYEFSPVPGKVVIDLFYNTFCLTSDIVAQHVREVAAEFGDRVVLNEHGVNDQAEAMAFGLSRAIFLNGRSVFWGYEAPKDGLRAEIEQELEAL
jgi:N-acetylglutamate synthase-like GNAT family acetyltransferase